MFFLRLLSRLPFRTLYAISDFLFFVTYHIIGYRKAIVRNNLKNSFPEKSDPELKQIEKEFYHNLCDYGVETLKLLTISEEELRIRMKFKNPEIVNPYAEQGQSILILASHQFNWEWLLAAGCFSLPMKVDFVYQTQKNQFFNNFSLQCRTRFGGSPIARSQVAREAIKRRGSTEARAIAIVADQFPGHANDKRFWTSFLHQETAFFQGIERLAELTQHPAFFFAITKVKRGYYEAEGSLISLPPYEKIDHRMLEEYARKIEKKILEFPGNWLWTHNRWKDRR
jgi:KDO2-lipid IV(A) lauroyltransferase